MLRLAKVVTSLERYITNFQCKGPFFSGRDPGEDIEMWLQQSEMTMGIPKFHRDTICIGFSNCQAELKNGTLGDWS